VDWLKGDGHHSLRILRCGPVNEGWPPLTHSVFSGVDQWKRDGCKRDGHCSLRLLSGGDGVDWLKGDVHHSLRILRCGPVEERWPLLTPSPQWWCYSVDWLEEGWSPLTPSLQVVMWCGLIGREMATTHSVSSVVVL
jgi:putative component of membrane protein insertase Oxa1/YidC/SpoIIIJ protein YidD